MTHRHIFKRQCTGRPQKGRSRGLICEYIMSWCQPNEILFEALTVSFCIGPVWVKRVCTSRSAMVGSYPLGYSGRNKVWVLLDYIYIYHYISINSPCHDLSISCSTLVCQTVLCRYFDASGVQAASLARCCSQYLYFRTLQKFRWDLVVIVERITIGFVDSPLFPSGRFYRMGYCFNSFWASRS